MVIFPTIFPALPKYPGPYNVGTLELEVPLQETKEWPATETKTETILVRLFYPAENENGVRRTSPTWLPQPTREYAKGYADFLKQPVLPTSFAISLAVCNTTIPALEHAQIIQPSPKSRFPIMVFSHGLGGSRNAYSQWCGSMASYGIFVAAIEHRDGSAPNSVVKAGTKEQYTVPYRRITEYNDETKHLRTSQLAQRTFEVSKLIALLRDINHGKVSGVSEEKRLHLDSFKDLLNTKKGQFIMAGHSFGAATAVAACKDKENDDAGYPLMDEFRAAIMLDIWMMPLSAIPTAQLTVPSLHVISEQFLKWQENYRAIGPLLQESRSASSFARAFYLKGSAHLSQSDFHLLFPRVCRHYFHAHSDAEKNMDVNIRAGIEFLRQAGIEGVKGERDMIFDENMEDWIELEGNDEELIEKSDEIYLEPSGEMLAEN